MQVGDLWVAELFHGPTLAFKDFGQQVLCKLIDHFLKYNWAYGEVNSFLSQYTQFLGDSPSEIDLKMKADFLH